MLSRYGSSWFDDLRFTCILPDRLKDELASAVEEEKAKHPTALTADHIVARLSLGFWIHLLTKSFEHVLWLQGMRRSFPKIDRHLTRADVHRKVDQLRFFRNRIAHHNAIFDRGPAAAYKNIQEIVSWVCADSLWLMKELANPARVIQDRPQC